MSRKRDTNWSRDEITVLLDSILEITKNRAENGKRTNSREVFEYAAKKMGERGHSSRAEREKCRTKWKKMKEEFTHAKRARGGDSRYKEAPGIQPFYDRMEEFINGNFDNISPHSTIVRRTSSTSSRQSSQAGMRISARIAASTCGTPTTNTSVSTSTINTTTNSNDNNDSSNTIATKSNTSTDLSSTIPIHTTPSNSPSSRQNSRLSSVSNNITNSNNDNNTTNSICNSVSITSKQDLSTSNHHNHQQQQQAIPNGDSSAIYSSYNNSTNSSNNNSNNNINNNLSSNSMLTSSPLHVQSNEHADISYRVSTGCRQITIFGDHDVDIKFRGDCVTINKIVADFPATET